MSADGSKECLSFLGNRAKEGFQLRARSSPGTSPVARGLSNGWCPLLPSPLQQGETQSRAQLPCLQSIQTPPGGSEQPFPTDALCICLLPHRAGWPRALAACCQQKSPCLATTLPLQLSCPKMSPRCHGQRPLGAEELPWERARCWPCSVKGFVALVKSFHLPAPQLPSFWEAHPGWVHRWVIFGFVFP